MPRLETFRRAILTVMAKAFAIVLVLPLLSLIEPFWKIRLTHLWCARFGPLAYNTHLWLGRRRLEGPEPRTTRIFIGANPANRALFEMWKRILPIIDSRILSAFYHYAGSTLSASRFFKPLPDSYDDHAAMATGPVLSFTDAEERRGRALLEEMGLGPDDWFVVFQNRDPNFHATVGNGDSGTHRFCAMSDFLPAVEAVTSRGGYAIRIGAAVSAPMPETGNPRIIDYATRHRTDWGDIYLLGRCRFLLCPGTGTVFVPGLFGRPVAQANMLPLIPNTLGPRSLYIPKLLRHTASGRILTFAELEKMGAYRYDLPQKAFLRVPSELGEHGLTAIDNEPNEILDLSLDMFDRLEGVAPDPEGVRLQAYFKDRFLGHMESNRLAPDIGGRFLLAHPELLTP